MKTLVLHPDDRSTDFLKKIYDDKGWTIITRWDIGGHALTAMVETHDRIIMMGHGSPSGLIGYGHIFINPEFIKVLQTKDTVCIWCHADQFVKKYGLKGFSTSMFISERNEGISYGINATQEQIDYSNNLFATELNKCIDDENLYQLIKESYNGNDPVIQFNNEGLLVL
jgi:hypothetical protein